MVSWVFEIILIIGLSIVLFYDLKYRIIPNSILAVLAFCGIIGLLLACEKPGLIIFNVLIVTILGIGIYILTNKKIGAGDIKLEIVISLFLNIKELSRALLISMLSVFFYCIVLLLFKRATLSTNIPLSPFIGFGVFTTLVIRCILICY